MALGNFKDKNRPASVGVRICAYLIDSLIYTFITISITFIWGAPSDDSLSYTAEGVPAFFNFILIFLLWPIAEGLFGQTIGKYLLRLKVMATINQPISMWQAFVRFFFGILDYAFLLGIWIALSRSDNKRIGDLVAGSRVVQIDYN